MPHPVGPHQSPSTLPAPDDPDLPRYGATFGEAVALFFKKYGTFEGRASRSEYWWIILLNTLVTVACLALMVAGGKNIFDRTSTEMPDAATFWLLLWLAYYLVTLFPNWALGTRRFHDANIDEPYLICMTPYVGLPIALFLAMKPSDPAGVRFDRGWVPPTDPSEQ